jgi:hypothetical protein
MMAAAQVSACVVAWNQAKELRHEFVVGLARSAQE